MFSKFTIIGLIIGSIVSLLGAASMIDSFANPNEIQDTNETFGVGDADKIRFNAPENSFQTITVTGEAFDLKIILQMTAIMLIKISKVRQLSHGQI